ncbi:MAG TPA: hypothetical protein VLA43_08470, partial [Longimicrobiales bacterium]|nr:hypothetical protein [Longimicrobiales bacterium]
SRAGPAGEGGSPRSRTVTVGPMAMEGRGSRRLVVGCLLALSASACWHAMEPGVSGRVDRAPAGADAVQMTYLGVGGWIFRRGGDQVVAAPLFTNPSFLRTGLAGIRSDTAAVNRNMAPYDVSGAVAILVGHAHYDHLLDVPHVARRQAPRAVILGSRTVKNTLGTWSGVADRVVLVDSLAGDQDHPGTWVVLSPRLRVLPLRSHHAPHFDGYTLYKGTTDRPLTEEPRWATEWLDGPSYAFLVDFLDPDGTVAFRIYYQDAVAAAPRGFAPDALVAERGVDVAVLVPATFDQVDWHPEAFVENLRPRWVLLGHWENFFVPLDEPTRSVMLTDVPHFEARLARVHDGGFWRPDLGTEFRFPVR